MSVTCDVIDVLFVSDVVPSAGGARRRTPICWLAVSPAIVVVTALLVIEMDGKVIVGSTLSSPPEQFATVPGLTPNELHVAMA